jgi:hypothetical protein
MSFLSGHDEVDKIDGSHFGVTGVCPFCGVTARFLDVDLEDLRGRLTDCRMGIRQCPHCGEYLFIHAEKQRVWTLPPPLIDFDSKGIPKKITKALEEAILDHANKCYLSAAIMVRKTLEILCEEQGVKGRFSTIVSKN